MENVLRIPTKLSVNINKIALIRNSRSGNLPDLLRVALDCEDFGAEGITVHPRPDERHIRFSDIPMLRGVLRTELNVEGNPTPAFMDLVLEHGPDQVTLVPDAPEALTSSGGWDAWTHASFLEDVIGRLKARGIRASIFIDPDPRQVEGAWRVGADRVELYTGDYALDYAIDRERAISAHRACALEAARLGVGLNAGHDLNTENLRYYREQLPNLAEVSIGHALVCDSLYYGLSNTIRMYRLLLAD